MRTKLGLAGITLLLACSTPSSRHATSGGGKNTAVEVVQKQLDAFNAQDLEVFLATYADDAVIATASTGKVLMEGKAVMRERYGSMFKKYPNSRCRIAERRTEGDRIVLDHEIITGARARQTGPLGLRVGPVRSRRGTHPACPVPVT